jgi:protein arginine kinase
MISDIRLGINLGIIKTPPIETVNELLIITGPAHIADICRDNTPENRDRLRAATVREKLNKGKEV